jgi:hypothetical protein
LPNLGCEGDQLHIGLQNLAGLGIALQELRHARVGLHDPQDDVRGAGHVEGELLGNLLEAGRSAGGLLNLNHEQRDLEEGVEESVQGLSLGGRGENLVEQPGHYERVHRASLWPSDTRRWPLPGSG